MSTSSGQSVGPKTLVLGAAGQLGQAICAELADWTPLTPSHAQCDITHQQQLRSYLAEQGPQLVINTAAFHDVPRAEQEGELAFAINTLGARHLASACQAAGARLLHISTDYVFGGTKGAPYLEGESTSPLNLYGETKLSGERQVSLHCASSWVVRTAGLFGHHPCRQKKGGRNFIETMRHLAATRDELKVVDDVRCCPTSVVDLAKQLRVMVERGAPFGVYHAVNPSGCTWFEFAKMIFEATKTRVKVTPVSQSIFDDGVPRPADSRLENGRLAELGMDVMQPLDRALADYLAG